MEYTHEDGDMFVDYSWERDFSIKEDVYQEWCLEFFSAMFFEIRVRTKGVLCGEEHVLTLPEFAVLLGLYEQKVNKCLESIECEKWTEKMFTKEFDMENMSLKQHMLLREPLRVENEEVWRKSMYMKKNYMLEHSMPILHHLANQANYTYPVYEPLNVLPYRYPYVPYPYPYTHYHDMGNQSLRGYQGAPRDGYIFTGAMPGYGGNFIVSSSGYELAGSSRGVHDDDEMSNQMVRSNNFTETGDDMND
uniref:Uncharacterized protein n=1 Tax=Tanacetum cinerariifolium TaxID=118510 RepID=A0A6L2K6Z6_TANCI|nr:hypothetical protein [Tanacetum cinerariifolium]